ncbi:hypothetical protein R3P38DRAFT_1883136 [Favolaschia claudopus]|uniref:F-box domain-containing protein n=1 Tax=Favolaschia claudopus TaxID=2862362 RepID=A0AAW0D976_9AGAR
MSPPSSFIAGLQGRIDELAQAIETQKTLLRNLEQEHSAARSRLNSFLDPMARLPLELQSDIFLRCMPLSQPKPSPYEAPMVFLSVSRLWNHIALATPALWAQLRIERLPRKAGVFSLCDLWLTRAPAIPLALTLHSTAGLDHTVRQFLARCGPRLGSLSLELALDFRPTSVVRQIILNAAFPLLETMTIESEDCTVLKNANDLVAPLRSSPVLVEYTIRNICMLYNPPDPSMHVEPLTHISLQKLHLGSIREPEYFCGRGSSADILRYVTLPSLRHLTITEFDITPDDFASFIARSSPPLYSLHVAIRIPDDVLIAWLRIIPSITHLLVAREFPEQFISSLSTDSSPHLRLLPNLRHLTLVPGMLSSPACQAVARMLDVRCARIDNTRLDSFRLVHPRALHEDVLVDLRRLVSEGLEVRFGKDGEKILV